MRVPESFMNEEQKNAQTQIFYKKYIEHESSRIYTKVEENLLVIVLRGSKKLVYQDFEATISEGQYAFFRKGNYIMNQIISEGRYDSLLIFLSDDFLKKIFELQDFHVCFPTPFYQGEMVPYMKEEVDKICELINRKEFDDIVRLKIMELLVYIQEGDKTGEFSNFMRAILLDRSFKDDIYSKFLQCQDIGELADLMHMSVSTLKRKFQKEFGCSPHLWMNEQKLEKAVVLLDTTDYSITDIGFVCGFSSLSTFMAQFKKKYGVSPGVYRKEKLVNIIAKKG